MMLNLRPLINTFCLSYLTLLPSCSDEDQAPKNSGNEIILDVAEWKPLAESRATVYDSETFIDHDKGGGEFALNAYVGTTDYAYLNGARVWCREDGDWGFIAANGSAIKYYWPATEHLTFFAYMPRDLSATFVSLGAYTAAGGQPFSCSLPGKIVFDGEKGVTKNDYVKDSELREFICAYTPDKFKEDVTMHFVHPFAIVDLVVTDAPVGLELQSITFKNIHLAGTCTVKADTGDPATVFDWEKTGAAESCEIWIERKVPNNLDLNLSVPIGGPYIVMPQTLDIDNVTMDVAYQKPGETSLTSSSIRIADGTGAVTAWEAGKKYTYALNFGHNGDDVSLTVTVEPWIFIKYENVVEVE